MTDTDLRDTRPTTVPPTQFRGSPDRWQPTRAGLLNVWQYDDEVLEFENGRLVLFGANGSGKTMALELLYPYLLDANASPSRLSTAGGNERGGLWSRVSGYDESASRVGYLWVEFARARPGCPSEHFTCGTRLAAKPGTGGNHHWFTTTVRVGGALALMDDNRVPLTPQALRAAIGTDGVVWGDDVAGYRNTVRATLYADFTADGYQSLIDGLLAVRKQSITDGLTPKRLNDLLTDGLPGLDPHELDHVARGFEHLDSRRDTIANLQEAVTASQSVARRVRIYARSALRLAADQVTSAQTALDTVTRQRSAAVTALDTATEALVTTEAALATARADLETLEVRERAVRESAGYASISELDQQRRGAEAAEEDAKRARRNEQQRAAEHTTAAERAQKAAQGAVSAEEATATAVRDLLVAARQVGLDAQAEPSALVTVERVRAEIELRQVAVAEVRTLIAAHTAAVRDRDQADKAVEEANEALSRRRQAAEAAEETLAATLTAWADNILTWASAAGELGGGPGDDTLRDAVLAAATNGDIDSFAAVVAGAYERASEALTRRATTLDVEIADVRAEQVRVTAERDALDAQRHALPPQLAPWRAPRPDGMLGAPLWALLDSTVDAHALAGIEAALEGAGVLDAWVHPNRIGPTLGDVVAHAATKATTSLAGPLAVDADAARAAGLDPAQVTAILEAIGYDDPDAHLSVGGNGTFRYGPLHGAVEVTVAGHIGATARERARQQRLSDLDAQLEDLAGAHLALTAQRSEVARRSALARSERDSAPTGRQIAAARTSLDVATARADDAATALEEARGRAAAADERARTVLAELLRAASTAALPTVAAELDQVDRALRSLVGRAGSVESAAHLALSAQREAAYATESARSRREEADTATRTADEHSTRANNARSRYDQLHRSVGAGAEAAAAELEALSSERIRLAKQVSDLDSAARTHVATKARAAAVLSAATSASEAAKVARDEASGWFVAAIDAGLADDGGIELGDEDLSTVTGVRNTVRAVNRTVTTAPDVQRLSRELSAVSEERFRTQKVLAGRAELLISSVERSAAVSTSALALSRFAAVVDGVEMRVHTMTDRFAAEHAFASGELADAETALFEDIFAGSLRTHLASRLRSAQHLVDSMNALLAGVRSVAGGVYVSLRWDVDDDAEDQATLTKIKHLLLRDNHSSDERAQLHSFLTRRIDQVRHDDRSMLSWRDALEALFDYRRWHSFHVMVRHSRFGERAVPFTSRKVSLSAGEKALVLSLPLFAAVASHYMPRDDGGPPRSCPRLLLLDEVFPKNDRANKRQILGLLTTLDLDCVLTSDKDRCDYDTVDGIAIAVISKIDDMSYSTRLVWNGSQLSEAAPTDLSALSASP